MRIDGKAIAEDIYADLAAQNRRDLRLGIVVGSRDAATESFVRIKTRAAQRLGVILVREELQEGATTNDAIEAVQRLGEKTNGVIVQLPLPGGIDAEHVLSAIPAEKDVDGVNPHIPDSARIVLAPVAEAVREILRHAGVSVRGKKTVVVGKGRLVGKPAAFLLRAMGAEVVALSSGDSLAPLAEADVAVLGAGVSGLIHPEHIKEGVVLIDAGTSEDAGKVAGDADPLCAEKAVVFTPVPGGVGPVAVAMIFKNLFALARGK